MVTLGHENGRKIQLGLVGCGFLFTKNKYVGRVSDDGMYKIIYRCCYVNY